MRRLHLIALLLSVAFCFSSQEAIGQSKEDIPMPEYYGLYGLIDGKLCGFDVPTANCSLKTVEVKMGRRAGVGNILNGEGVATTFPVKAFELQKGIRFIIYRENPSSLAGLLNLTPMVFVRNITVDTGWPNHVRRSGVENGWDTGNPSELGGEMGKLNESIAPIQMLIKPLKPNMVLAVPARELTPGLYHFALGQDVVGNQPGIYFWIGNAKEAEADKCVDATYEYAMNLSKSNYVSCAGEMRAALNGAADANSAGSSGADAIMGELLAVQKQVIEAQMNGDKATLESLLAENFTLTDTGNHKTLDRAKFLSRVKRDKSIKNFECTDYQLKFESETAVLSGLCEYDIQQLLLSLHVRERFTDRFIKKDGKWLAASGEYIILPNNQQRTR